MSVWQSAASLVLRDGKLYFLATVFLNMTGKARFYHGIKEVVKYMLLF